VLENLPVGTCIKNASGGNHFTLIRKTQDLLLPEDRQHDIHIGYIEFGSMEKIMCLRWHLTRDFRIEESC